MTGVAVGNQTVFGVSALESTFGTPVTVDRFYEITGESLKRKNRIMQSKGFRGGTRNLPRGGGRRVQTGREAAGDVSLEVATTTFGRLFRTIVGPAPTIAQQGATTAYKQTYSMGSLLGSSFTAQKQLRDGAQNLIQTLTYPGSKVVGAEFKNSVDDFLVLTLSLDCQDERDDIAAATASYGTTALFHFQQAAITVAGSAAAYFSDFSLKLDNVQKTDRRYLGNQGLKAEQTDNGFPGLTGSFTEDVVDHTLYDLFKNDTAAALVITYTGALIETPYSATLKITVPEVHFTGDTAAADKAEDLSHSTPWEAAYDGTNAGLKIEYTTTDTAA